MSNATPIVDVDRARALGFGLERRCGVLDGGWHLHRRHQIMQAHEGSLELIEAEDRWLLPRAQAAWIPAGVRHRVRSSGAHLRTVYLAPSLVSEGPTRTVVIQLPPLGAALLDEAMRWPHHRRLDRRARALFRCIAEEFTAWSASPGPFRLPRARSPEVASVMAWISDSLAERPTLSGAARMACMSPRSFERRFMGETGICFRDFVLRARMIEAQRLLSIQGARVSEVAYAVGYSTPSAFSNAFLAHVGCRPKSLCG